MFTLGELETAIRAILAEEKVSRKPNVSKREAAEILRVSERTIGRMISEGTLKVALGRGRCKVLRASVDALLSERQGPRTSAG